MAEFVEVMRHKKRMCDIHKISCENCDLIKEVRNKECGTCDIYMEKSPQQAEEIIMNWAKKHPVKTNEDKFKEIFELELDSLCNNISCDGKCDECNLYIFGNKEYKEPKGE